MKNNSVKKLMTLALLSGATMMVPSAYAASSKKDTNSHYDLTVEDIGAGEMKYLNPGIHSLPKATKKKSKSLDSKIREKETFYEIPFKILPKTKKKLDDLDHPFYKIVGKNCGKKGYSNVGALTDEKYTSLPLPERCIQDKEGEFVVEFGGTDSKGNTLSVVKYGAKAILKDDNHHVTYGTGHAQHSFFMPDKQESPLQALVGFAGSSEFRAVQVGMQKDNYAFGLTFGKAKDENLDNVDVPLSKGRRGVGTTDNFGKKTAGIFVESHPDVAIIGSLKPFVGAGFNQDTWTVKTQEKIVDAQGNIIKSNTDEESKSKITKEIHVGLEEENVQGFLGYNIDEKKWFGGVRFKYGEEKKSKKNFKRVRR